MAYETLTHPFGASSDEVSFRHVAHGSGIPSSEALFLESPVQWEEPRQLDVMLTAGAGVGLQRSVEGTASFP
jgi:hypothetical protein